MRKLVAALILISLSLAGCTPADSLYLKFHATHELNIDNNGHNKPLLVIAYQLTKPLPFKTKSYSQLTLTPEKSLPNTLIDFQKIVLRPGKKITLKVNLDPATHYIGIICGYHHLYQKKWKLVVVINPHYFTSTKYFHLSINGVHHQSIGSL